MLRFFAASRIHYVLLQLLLVAVATAASSSVQAPFYPLSTGFQPLSKFRRETRRTPMTLQPEMLRGLRGAPSLAAAEGDSPFVASMKPPPPLEGSDVSSDTDASESSYEAVVADTAVDSDLRPLREPLKFSFAGYSIWLELEQIDSDLNRALEAAAIEEGVMPIPCPHVTVLYGMDHLMEEEMRARFNGKVREAIKSWPALRAIGILCDRSWDGVDGCDMDMAWIEITLATSAVHESFVDRVYDIYHGDCCGSADIDSYCTASGCKARPRPWTPHLSLAYDNPDEGTNFSLGMAVKLASKFPTLLGRDVRKVMAISLWRTEGRMEDWTRLDRIELDR